VPEQPFAPEQTTRDITIERVRAIRQALEAQGVRHAFLFGSVARGDDVPESDIDIVLDLDPNRHIGLFAFESIREILEAQLGRKVDLGSLRSLRPGRHDDIIRDLVEAF
jgi:predicted nucleotidyltransferase